jgi:hypothetical protein
MYKSAEPERAFNAMEIGINKAFAQSLYAMIWR